MTAPFNIWIAKGKLHIVADIKGLVAYLMGVEVTNSKPLPERNKKARQEAFNAQQEQRKASDAAPDF